MKATFRFLLTASFLIAALYTQAQVRYLNEIFSGVTVDTSIVYQQNYDFFAPTTLASYSMDIYRPTGDTTTRRPVVILAHNGYFLPEAITHGVQSDCYQNRRDSSLIEICKRFAKRGYVAIAFSYRTGWSANSAQQETRAKSYTQALYRGMQDARTLVRYLKSNYSTGGNLWGVDTSKIVVGGTAEGGSVALAAGAFNTSAELANPKFSGSSGAFIDQSVLGDFNGLNGTQCYNNYPGYSSRFSCVLSLGGALGDSSWVQAGEPPVIAFQGVDDAEAPYNEGYITTATGSIIIDMVGAGNYMRKVSAAGNNNVFLPNSFPQGPPNINASGVQTASIEGLYPFYGAGFEPWNWYYCSMVENPTASRSRAMLYIDTIMGFTTQRLYKDLINSTYTGTPQLTVTLSGSSSVCSGTVVTLTPAISGGSGPYTYAWASTGNSLSCNNCASPTVTITQNSTFSVTVTGTGSASGTATKAINVNALPTVTLTVSPAYISRQSASVALSGGSPAGGSYSGPGVSGGSITPSLAGLGSKRITYSYTNGNTCTNTATSTLIVYDTIGGPCTDTTHITVHDTIHTTVRDTITTSVSVTDTLRIDVTLTGINPPGNINTLTIYPNPARDHLIINNGDLNTMTGYTIKVTNALGQVVFTQQVNQQQFYIDLNSWQGTGTYIVYVLDASQNVKSTREVVLY